MFYKGIHLAADDIRCWSVDDYDYDDHYDDYDRWRRRHAEVLPEGSGLVENARIRADGQARVMLAKGMQNRSRGATGYNSSLDTEPVNPSDLF